MYYIYIKQEYIILKSITKFKIIYNFKCNLDLVHDVMHGNTTVQINACTVTIQI